MKLLAIASRPTHCVEMAELAQALAARGHQAELLYVHNTADLETVGSASPSLASLEAAGVVRVRVVDLAALWGGPERRSPADWLRALRRLRRAAPALVRSGRPLAIRRAIVMVGHYDRMRRFFDAAFADGGFDAALVPEDIVGPVWPVAIQAAHRRGMPVLVFPYTIANRNEPVQSLRHEPDFQTTNNELAARLYPRWRLARHGVDLVRLPSAHVFAHEALGIAPPDPWMMNSGHADTVCVDSAAAFEYFREAGLPAERMDVVGSVSQDVMFELRRDRLARLADLRRDLGLAGEKPLLLLSGCPDQLAGKVPGCDFTRFEDIAAFVGESLAPMAADYHLVVRPHPHYPEFGPMLAPYGFAIATIPTSRLVPLASLFVAFASATIRWAIACAVPTVNYDVFHYGYGEFASAAGVISTSDRTTFRDAVRRLRPATDSYDQLSARIQVDSERWSRMDGEGTGRIEDAIRRAVARRASAAGLVERTA